MKHTTECNVRGMSLHSLSWSFVIKLVGNCYQSMQHFLNCTQWTSLDITRILKTPFEGDRCQETISNHLFSFVFFPHCTYYTRKHGINMCTSKKIKRLQHMQMRQGLPDICVWCNTIENSMTNAATHCHLLSLFWAWRTRETLTTCTNFHNSSSANKQHCQKW